MSMILSRRRFLAATTAFGAASLLGGRFASAALPQRRLVAARRTIDVNGKAASVFALQDAAGRSGLVFEPGERFAVTLENEAGEPTIVHWHGQTPPPSQDGVTDTGYADPLAPGETQSYDFVPRPGTHWMHSHHGLQEQMLMAAPLIVRSEADRAADRQEVTVLLHDFTFRDPADILAELAGGMGMDHGGMSMGGEAGNSGGMGMGMSSMQMGDGGMDLNDVAYDAYLANDRTLDDPEVVRTEAGGRVLVRLINGATSTAFWIDLAGTVATVIAVDGNAVTPVSGSSFPLAQGQRLALELTVPAGGAVAVLAQRERGREPTGIVLAAPDATNATIPPLADTVARPLDLSLEVQLAAAVPPAARPADVTHSVMLTGAMMRYLWSIDGLTWQNRRPLQVRRGQRVVIDMMNHSMMAHPMHLHGHHFQVVALNGVQVAGAVRDTVLVPPMGRATIAFDADNPGRWLFHCHNLYHMATGMMTEVIYKDAV